MDILSCQNELNWYKIWYKVRMFHLFYLAILLSFKKDS